VNIHSSSSRKNLYLLDGSGLIFRSYHALPPLTRSSDGLPIGAIAGVCNKIYQIIRNTHELRGWEASHIAAIFDARGKTFRHDLYPEYKANRPPPPDDLIHQFELVRAATRAFGLLTIESPGFEADDIIATLARQGEQEGFDVIIVSSDKDMLQLVSDKVRVWDGKNDSLTTFDGVLKKFGVLPEKVIDVLALAGDASDNVPGAPGIGVKIAAQLINDYGSLDNLLELTDTIPQTKRRQVLIDKKEQILLSRELVTLKHDIQLPCTVHDCWLKQFDPDAALSFLSAMELHSICNRVAQHSGVSMDTITPNPELKSHKPASESISSLPQKKQHVVQDQYTLIRTIHSLEQYLIDIQDRGIISMCVIQPPKVNGSQDQIILGLSIESGEGICVTFSTSSLTNSMQNGELYSDFDHKNDIFTRDDIRGILSPILADSSIIKVGFDLKETLSLLKMQSFQAENINDVSLMTYILSHGQYPQTPETILHNYAEHIPASIHENLKELETNSTAHNKAAIHANALQYLYPYLKRQLVKMHLYTIYESLERPMLKVLLAMESEGIRIDIQKLRELSVQFQTEMASLESKIYEISECPFNIASTQKTAEILFKKLQLPSGRKTKTGAYGTDSDILENLAQQGHIICSNILKWRHLSKLRSTYCESLQKHVNPQTSRIHTTFHLAATSTGRLSSSSPNLQNIPVRTLEGQSIRSSFVPSDDCYLVSFDYNQVELRILAHIANVSALKEAFDNDIDIHRMIASQVFEIAPDSVSEDMRQRAKAINFGIIYGISAYGLAKQLKIPPNEAKNLINRYFEQFPEIRCYMTNVVAQAHAVGYVSTLFGRKIHIKRVSNRGGTTDNLHERAAINAPIQGSASDIIRKAMIKIYNIQSKNSKMLLQIHDELIFEIKKTEFNSEAIQISNIMENAHKHTLMEKISMSVNVNKL
jgi:DNA polymerase-1